MTAYVYILTNHRDGTLYIGLTTNLAKRITDHKAGRGGAFTARYKLTQLVHVETYENLGDARAREYALKRWRRSWKNELIEADNPNWNDLSSLIHHC